MQETIERLKELGRRCTTGWSVSQHDLQFVAGLLENAPQIYCSANAKTDVQKLLSLSTRFLSNAAVSSSILRQNVWQRFYPKAILAVSRIKDDCVVDPLCYCLWNCLKEEVWSLKDDADIIIMKNLVQFYGDVDYTERSTTFSLLLGAVLKKKLSFLIDICCEKFLFAIGRADIDCLNQLGAVPDIVTFLFAQAKKTRSLASLTALGNTISVNGIEENILDDIALWTILTLKDIVENESSETGIKTSLVSLLANLVHESVSRQSIVLGLNGMELVLNCIKLDDKNPFMREWALLFLRNMCFQNRNACSFMENLELKEVSTNEKLRLSIEFDKGTGKFKVLAGT